MLIKKKNYALLLLLLTSGLMLSSCQTEGDKKSEGEDTASIEDNKTEKENTDIITTDYTSMMLNIIDEGNPVQLIGKFMNPSTSDKDEPLIFTGLNSSGNEIVHYYIFNEEEILLTTSDLVTLKGIFEGSLEEGRVPRIRVTEIDMNNDTEISNAIDKEYHDKYPTNMEGLALFNDVVYSELEAYSSMGKETLSNILQKNILLSDTVIEFRDRDVIIDSNDPEWINFIEGNYNEDVSLSKEIWINNFKRPLETLYSIFRERTTAGAVILSNPVNPGRLAFRLTSVKDINYDVVTMTTLYDDIYDTVAAEYNQKLQEEVGKFIFNNDDNSYEIILAPNVRKLLSDIKTFNHTDIAEDVIEGFVQLHEEINGKLNSQNEYGLTIIDYDIDDSVVLEILNGKVVKNNLLNKE